MMRRSLVPPALGLVLALAGCASSNTAPDSTAAAPASAAQPSSSGGRYAMTGDAYPESPPDVSQVPNATPRVEPRSSAGNRSTYEVWGKTYHVMDDARGYSREGTASWYGQKFHGYATSNGEIYDMYKMTAAHKNLPLPSYAQVTNLDNGRSVIVRVNDRGPFHDDREIDLSYAAASRLDILGHGTGNVRVTAIDPQQWQANGGKVATPAPAAAVSSASQRSASTSSASSTVAAKAPQAASPAASSSGSSSGSGIFLQVAALGSADGARSLQSELQGGLNQSVRVENAAGLYKVQVGPLASRSQVEPVRQALSQAGFPQAFVVSDQ
ncbi:septal ring lytic transglycosylase RlpA family protein [Halomonas huangheensis]|uniref:Endolytic peptidoglycan transglycosylase RlpA n=1 Tax=Halomonas huangheensis TaxID=1178482 RepID=W1NBV0_9GAMM|nr:septal ring lytic transglycosylase RlpA family protein [Halomonas huangheensis]ERL53037.1 hypothetical protein BJB45_18135 [Halomonas huangheensis]